MAVPSILGLLQICICFMLLDLTVIQGINLDARFSVIKKGKQNSYFGYSVAQHQILNGQSVVENVLLIGAPKEARIVQGKKSGGALRRCNARDEQETCQIIEDGLSDPPLSSEKIDDQWLGVTVASQGAGRKAVACAHRFIKDNAAVGECRTLVPELDSLDQILRPCTKFSHSRFLEDFGLCQAGMSASAGQEDSLVMGAPGSIFWKGVIFLGNISDELGASSTEIPSPFADPKRLDGDKQPAPTSEYSYNGYAVAMGRFDGSKALYYVSGAPKSQNKGEIVFFKQKPKGTLRYEAPQIITGELEFSGFGSNLLAVDLNNDGFDDLLVGAPFYYKRNRGGAFYVYLGGQTMINKDTLPTKILSRTMGDEECELLRCEHARFGISLTKLGDINMDSYQDFAVGAPYEGKGAVYIYHGSKSAAGFNTKYAQRIEASDLPDPNLMSFGHSLSGGMDLDENGYPDLLVGAYESDAVALIRSRPIIKLIPNLRVSPKAVDLEATPECTSPDVKPEFADKHCVEVKVCLSFTTKPANSITVVPRVLYRLEAEPKRRVARVELQNAKDLSKKIVENKEIVLSASGETCATEIALLKAQFEDKLNPMEFRFSFGLSTDSEKPDPFPSSSVQDVNLFPVLDTDGSDQELANSVSVEAEFVMECGDDNKCNSNLQFSAELKNLKTNSQGTYEIIISRENHLEVEMKVSNEEEPAYLTKIYVQKPAGVTYLGVESEDQVTCQRLEEDDTMIMCNNVGNPLRSGQGVYLVLRLNVPREMSETAEIYNVTAWVNTSSIERTPLNDRKIMNFRVINKAEIFLDTNVSPDNAILCQGEPRGASAMTNEIDIGAKVRHNFIVRNAGPGVVSESYITIKWPYEVARDKGSQGKFLLYLMRKPQIVGPVVKCNDDEIAQYINPLNIKEVVESKDPDTGASRIADDGLPVTVDGVESLPADTTDSKRKKRDAEVRAKRATGGVVSMSCQDDTARCFEFKCKLGKLEPNQDYVKITMESRLWESTLLSDYRKAADVQIISWGFLTLPEKLMITQDPKNDQKRAITRAVPDFKETSGQTVQWWIILVAVLVGIIVLLVVIFILYKLGFFRRKRLEDMQMYKAEKKQQPMLQDEYDDDGV